MKIIYRAGAIAGISILTFACNPLLKLEAEKDKGSELYNQFKFEEAYQQLSNTIDLYQEKNIEIPAELWEQAASSAKEIGKYQEAVNYYDERLKSEASADVVKGKIESLQQLQQFDAVKLTLQENEEMLFTSDANFYFNALFDANLATASSDEVVKSFKQLNSPNEKQSLGYLTALEEQDTNEAIKQANEVIKNNPDYNLVKEWTAQTIFKKAEVFYQEEMEKYNKDKNYTAYLYLRRELKKVSSDYRAARDLYQQLHETFPEEKKYIRSLKNCYVRLDMKKEAAALDKLLK